MDERELIMTCEACQRPVEDKQGWLWVDREEVKKHERAVRDWTKEHETEPGGAVSFTIGDTFELPPHVAWHAHHRTCDPNPDSNAYTIETERISTWADLVHWTAHLMAKPWVASTDWDKILEGAAAGDGPRLWPAVRSKLHA